MRRFRFIADKNIIDPHYPVKGKIYNEDYSWGTGLFNVLELFEMYKEEWEEVFNEPKPLHKDTDLGYFSLELMKSFISIAPYIKKNEDSCNELFVKDCISISKELIKQLDQETK